MADAGAERAAVGWLSLVAGPLLTLWAGLARKTWRTVRRFEWLLAGLAAALIVFTVWVLLLR